MKFPPCPSCKRKGLHYADHPHAYGWKDVSRATCRFCHKTFKVSFKSTSEAKKAIGGKEA